jgi:hypothetical protein
MNGDLTVEQSNAVKRLYDFTVGVSLTAQGNGHGSAVSDIVTSEAVAVFKELLNDAGVTV